MGRTGGRSLSLSPAWGSGGGTGDSSLRPRLLRNLKSRDDNLGDPRRYPVLVSASPETGLIGAGLWGIEDGGKPHRVRANKFIFDLLSPLLLYSRANWAIRSRAAWMLILLI
jgi:hypothetical protein